MFEIALGVVAGLIGLGLLSKGKSEESSGSSENPRRYQSTEDSLREYEEHKARRKSQGLYLFD